MTNDKDNIAFREEITIEDWIGDDAEQRQKRGAPPDETRSIITWYRGGTVVTDPAEIARLERKHYAPR